MSCRSRKWCIMMHHGIFREDTTNNVGNPGCHKPPILEGLYHPFRVILRMVCGLGFTLGEISSCANLDEQTLDFRLPPKLLEEISPSLLTNFC